MKTRAARSLQIFESRLQETCTIQRYTDSGRDSHGQPTKVFADFATGVKCWLDEKPGMQRAETGQIQQQGLVVADALLFLKGSQDVLEADRIVHGGKTWEILLIRQGKTQDATHHKELDLKLVRKAG